MLTALEQNTISKALATAKKLLDEIKPVIDQLNIIYDSAGGAKSTVDQEGLDAVTSFSGLTKQQLDDGCYVLTATMKDAINNGFSQLAQLAARA